MQVLKSNTLPASSVIGQNFGPMDYLDVFTIKVRSQETIDELARKFFYPPKWILGLMKIRNSIVKPFGLKTSYDEKLNSKREIKVGKNIGYFMVIAQNPNEIIMAENDKHLDFRTSILKKDEIGGQNVSIITIIRYNNFFGRLYFWIVKPFHRRIVKSMMQRIVKSQ